MLITHTFKLILHYTLNYRYTDIHINFIWKKNKKKILKIFVFHLIYTYIYTYIHLYINIYIFSIVKDMLHTFRRLFCILVLHT